MNNKIIEFLSKREEFTQTIYIHGGKKETYDKLLEKFPTKEIGDKLLDSCCKHSYSVGYPNLDIIIFLDYNETELKERAREIALASAEKSAESACMQKWRETQEAKKE